MEEDNRVNYKFKLLTMTNEEFDRKWENVYMERVNNSHIEPAPETRERLAKLETNHTNLMEKIEEILTRFDKFEDKLDKALDKKAGIWVERVLYGAGGLAGIYGLNKLLELLFK